MWKFRKMGCPGIDRKCSGPCLAPRWLDFLGTLRPEAKEEIHDFAAGLRTAGQEVYLQFRDRVVFVVGEASGPSPAKRLRLLDPLTGRLPLALCLARDGFVASAGALGANEAAKALASLDQHAARVLGPGAQAEDLQGEQRFKIHLLYPWAARLVTHPSLLEAVRAGLGTENVLVWFSEVNAKGPLSSLHAAPHQDFIFASLAPNDAVLTAWLALTDAATEMGGLFFRRHSHLHGQLPHCVDDKAENLIGFHCCDAEFLAGAQEDEDAVPVELGAGEASLHTFRTLHWSGPNLTNERRVGLAIRYVRADVGRNRKLPCRESAMLACGSYDPAFGAFDLEPPPSCDAGPKEREVHADALARERENYSDLDTSDPG